MVKCNPSLTPDNTIKQAKIMLNKKLSASNAKCLRIKLHNMLILMKKC